MLYVLHSYKINLCKELLMSKGKDSQKNAKKAAGKTLKEKRKEKKAKKANKKSIISAEL